LISRILVLGAAGDLATRHLLPALAHLVSDGRLPPDVRVSGIGREPLDSAGYRDLAVAQLEAHAAHLPLADRAALVSRLEYSRADLDQSPDLRSVLGEGPVIAYLALPPSLYPAAVEALRVGGVAAGSRIVLEKPFGVDLASARRLNSVLHSVFSEEDVFRVDHFLHHQSVQDLIALRFGNPIFEPLWRREHVERVEITWEETAGVAGRVDFYDRTGALRDMVQSHLLQVLALVAMEVPSSFDERRFRDEKLAVLRRVRPPTGEDIARRTARGRYGQATRPGRVARGYLQEAGVDPSRETETYAWLQMEVDTPRWRGVPFVLRTGKALGLPRRRVAVQFRAAKGPLSGGPAVLGLEMAPDRVTLELSVVDSAGLPALVPTHLQAVRPRQPLPASARILLDVLAGDPTLAIRDDEAEHCWRIVDAVLEGWRAGAPPLQEYAAGSNGPTSP
jgi:glucose-6-phosphate 1-dehydrogenase